MEDENPFADHLTDRSFPARSAPPTSPISSSGGSGNQPPCASASIRHEGRGVVSESQCMSTPPVQFAPPGRPLLYSQQQQPHHSVSPPQSAPPPPPRQFETVECAPRPCVMHSQPTVGPSADEDFLTSWLFGAGAGKELPPQACRRPLSGSGDVAATAKPPCFVCRAPWSQVNGFLEEGQHSRQCRRCSVSFCHSCKETHMVRRRSSLIEADSQVWLCRRCCVMNSGDGQNMDDFTDIRGLAPPPRQVFQDDNGPTATF